MSQTQNTLQDVLIQTLGAHLGQIGDIAEQTQGTCLQIARNLAINAMVRGTKQKPHKACNDIVHHS